METSPVDPENVAESRVVEPAAEMGSPEVVDEETLEESVPRRKVPDPRLPSPEEVAAHNIDNYPYRCWCEHCVSGRGTGEQHRRGPECRIPVISFD